MIPSLYMDMLNLSYLKDNQIVMNVGFKNENLLQNNYGLEIQIWELSVHRWYLSHEASVHHELGPESLQF